MLNITAPAMTAYPLNTSNMNTEAARRDNVLRETVPQVSNAEESAAESGLGSESDRVKKPGQPPQPLTYDRSGMAGQANNALNKDNGEDPSAGKQDARSRQEQQQEASEQKEVEELKERDKEVRTHEQAHASVGGQYAGSPSYEFETGPDGQRYAIGGEVSIDVSREPEPEETLRKMQQVRAAALAPAEPSPQDLRVASEAQQKAAEARQQMAEERAEALGSRVSNISGSDNAIAEPPELEDIVSGSDISPPTRKLREGDPVAEAAGLESDSSEFRRANRDLEIDARALRIASFYQQIDQPRQSGLQQSA
nr:putative metalloprotease CJM1_0395 family protein [Lacimicrobium alkaliphilum]